MPSYPSRQLVRRFAGAALASTVAGGAVGAQPFTSRFAVAGVQAADPPAGIACGSQSSVPGPGIISESCTLRGGEFTIRARAVDGRVGAHARVEAGALGGPTSTIFDAQAQGQWGDRLVFTGLVPATVLMDVQWDGLLAGSATGGGGANVMAAWNFQASGARGIVVADYHDSRSIVAVGNPISGGLPNVSEVVLDQRSFIMPVIPTGTTAPPFLDFLLLLFARGTVVVGSETGGAIATADFDDTGLITRLAFFDAVGNDITSSVPYEFSRGTLIGPIVTAAPEPATVTLVAGGLLALGAVGRRRRA
jgi:uncharacterized protein (TIGR03382 family)